MSDKKEYKSKLETMSMEDIGKAIKDWEAAGKPTKQTKSQKVANSWPVKWIKNFFKNGLRFWGAIFGVTENTIHSSDESLSQPYNSTSSKGFRESYHADVRPTQTRNHEQWILDQRAHIAYHSMVDGKGDPQHCDCNHDER